MIRKLTRFFSNPQLYLDYWLIRQIHRLQRRAEGLHDKQIRSKLKYCGKGVRFNGRIVITGHEDITMCDNVHIGDNAFIKGEGGLFIGANTHISRNFTLYTVNHNYLGTRLPYDDTLVKKAVHIGCNVWIGMNVSIIPGTTIGDGAIIGMGAVVFGEIPSLSIVGASSWRIIGQRDAHHYRELDELGIYSGISGRAVDHSDESDHE